MFSKLLHPNQLKMQIYGKTVYDILCFIGSGPGYGHAYAAGLELALGRIRMLQNAAYLVVCPRHDSVSDIHNL